MHFCKRHYARMAEKLVQPAAELGHSISPLSCTANRLDKPLVLLSASRLYRMRLYRYQLILISSCFVFIEAVGAYLLFWGLGGHLQLQNV